MAFVRVSRDKRGYEHIYLIDATARRGKTSRPRVLYWFRTPPGVTVGREPFAHRLGERLNQNRESIRPQIIYGYLKNNAAGSKNPFPSKQNTDGAWIVDEAAANTWYDALQGRKGDREKAKAEKEKADAAKANTAAAVAPTPETSKA